MDEQEEIAVRKATPAETAAFLVKSYDDAFKASMPQGDIEPRLAALLSISARLADFVATQYEVD